MLRGKVVLVDFWTYSCINCLRTLPYLKAWDEKYRAQGLVIIGVHSPEFSFEKDLQNVERAVRDLGIKYPVALDNQYAIWNAYENEYWPAHYLIDAQGRIRHQHFGEGAYRETEQMIQSLLKEGASRLGAERTRAGEWHGRDSGGGRYSGIPGDISGLYPAGEFSSPESVQWDTMPDTASRASSNWTNGH